MPSCGRVVIWIGLEAAVVGVGEVGGELRFGERAGGVQRRVCGVVRHCRRGFGGDRDGHGGC